jgi:hypothetical protein
MNRAALLLLLMLLKHFLFQFFGLELVARGLGRDLAKQCVVQSVRLRAEIVTPQCLLGSRSMPWLQRQQALQQVHPRARAIEVRIEFLLQTIRLVLAEVYLVRVWHFFVGWPGPSVESRAGGGNNKRTGCIVRQDKTRQDKTQHDTTRHDTT